MRSRVPAARTLAVVIEEIAGILYIFQVMRNVWSLEDLDNLRWDLFPVELVD